MKCPKCGGNSGYYSKYIQRYTQYYLFNGDPDYASDADHVKGGKLKYCSDCHNDITKFVDNLEVIK